MVSKVVLTAVRLFIFFSVVCGILYPLCVTAFAALVFPGAASGSLVWRDGKLIGSELIGQPFTSERYFWGRPSATLDAPYDGPASGGSNLAQSNPALIEQIKGRVEKLKTYDPPAKTPVPVDLVTTSASGLDPHISPAAALFQAERIAKARGISKTKVVDLIAASVERRTFGVLGEPRVNVLRLNLALDALIDDSKTLEAK
jgi:potassium-transporting ATPase KdpC subunit